MIPNPNIHSFLCLQDAKICFSDDTLPDGFHVKKGDMVAFQPYAMGRMKFLWGEDAEEFRPERFLNEDGVFRPESPFKFTAFQVGLTSFHVSSALFIKESKSKYLCCSAGRATNLSWEGIFL